jgi:hypothetical protein
MESDIPTVTPSAPIKLTWVAPEFVKLPRLTDLTL